MVVSDAYSADRKSCHHAQQYDNTRGLALSGVYMGTPFYELTALEHTRKTWLG